MPASHKDLREVLASLYPDIHSIRRIVADSGIAETSIVFDTTATNCWHVVLAEAEKQGLVEALLSVVKSEFSRNERFRNIYNSPQSIQTYVNITKSSFSDIDHILRDPQKIYLSLNCASVFQGDQTGEDAIKYIDKLLKEKPAVLIIGDYGTGKSFLTQRIFLRNADAIANGQSLFRIPILLPLKRLVGLASRDKDMSIMNIIEHLRKWQFFSDAKRTEADEKAEIEARLRAGEFLCILDGFDEIPSISLWSDRQSILANLVNSLAIGHNRLVITSRPGILPGVLSPEFANSLPNLGVGYLLPWPEGKIWWEYLAACLSLDIFKAGEYQSFGEAIISRPKLRELTRTPLFCQMLVETRDDILQLENFNLAKLYETYVGRYFKNVSERSPIQSRLRDLEKEVTYKKSCLMATAVGMANRNSLRLTTVEIDQALKYEAQEYDDKLLAEFTHWDVLIYSLLIGDVDHKFSFSHKSFYDFFVALKIYKELLREEDRFALLSRLSLTKEIVSFLSNFINSNPSLQLELQGLFAHIASLSFSNRQRENKILLRNLALTQLESGKRLEKVNLNDINFSGYALSSADTPRELVNVNLDGCILEGAFLTRANLRESSLRAANLNRCILDKSDLRNVDLSGTELQDISCRETRFSGANFANVILRASDIANIMSALYAERGAFPNTVTEVWIKETENTLREAVV